VVERNVRAQAQLIDDLLDVSRIISGKVRLDTKSLELADVLHAALETVRPAAQAKGVKLEPVIGSSAAPVTGDPARLQQVIWNLLTNAIKFTSRGGKVQLLLEQEASSVVVSVSDNGEGIEPEFLAHVFERFRQADGSASRSHGGLGLGLSIVKSLTEMHGGAVSANSAGKGKGACFRIRLPVRSLAAETSEPRVRKKDVSAAMPGYRPNLEGVRVLIVDDEPDARTMMHRLLLSSKALPEEAAGASEALDAIAAFHPDVIISDIGMPGMDGYTFIREARRRGTGVPAIALTAFARSEDRIRSIQAGYQAHLSKPVEPTELLTLVASLCGRIDSSALEAGGFTVGDAIEHKV
jgi:CheY-like chemotaxis protein/two-component sensor histidine kinase